MFRRPRLLTTVEPCGPNATLVTIHGALSHRRRAIVRESFRYTGTTVTYHSGDVHQVYLEDFLNEEEVQLEMGAVRKHFGDIVAEVLEELAAPWRSGIFGVRHTGETFLIMHHADDAGQHQAIVDRLLDRLKAKITTARLQIQRHDQLAAA